MGMPPNRTTTGISSSKRGAGVISPAAVAGEVAIEGRPAVAIFNAAAAAAGAQNVNMPPASDYTGGQLVFGPLTGDVGNPITIVPNGSDTLVNDPSPITAIENLVAYSDGSNWRFFALTPA